VLTLQDLLRTRTAQPQLNKAWYLDGSKNMYIVVNDSPTINPSNEITIELWTYSVQDMLGGSIWTCLRKATNQYLVEPGDAGTNYWALFLAQCGRVDTSSPVPIKQWHYIIGRFSAYRGVMQILVDGSVSGSKTCTAPIPYQSGPLYIGKWSGEIYIGYVPLVRIYSRFLVDSEVRHNMLNPNNPVRDGLVLWLDARACDASKNICWDLSGNGNHGTMYNVQIVSLSNPVRVGGSL
jgi:hypothetical protein